MKINLDSNKWYTIKQLSAFEDVSIRCMQLRLKKGGVPFKTNGSNQRFYLGHNLLNLSDYVENQEGQDKIIFNEQQKGQNKMNKDKVIANLNSDMVYSPSDISKMVGIHPTTILSRLIAKKVSLATPEEQYNQGFDRVAKRYKGSELIDCIKNKGLLAPVKPKTGGKIKKQKPLKQTPTQQMNKSVLTFEDTMKRTGKLYKALDGLPKSEAILLLNHFQKNFLA